jgi:hypothetical protein
MPWLPPLPQAQAFDDLHVCHAARQILLVRGDGHRDVPGFGLVQHPGLELLLCVFESLIVMDVHDKDDPVDILQVFVWWV